MGDPRLDPLRAQSILRRYNIRPRRQLGQNFIISPGSLDQIVEAARLQGDETVLEIGAGLGALTLRLARRVRQVVAVELDRRLIPLLKQILGEDPSIRLINADILELEWASLGLPRRYQVVANIPYSITSSLIRRTLEAPTRAEALVLTVQHEVARRVVAGPGEMSLLALSIQIYGKPRIAARIPAGSFYPKPEVDSAVLRIDVHGSPVVPEELVGVVFKLARAGFGQRRKQLRNSIAGSLAVSAATVERWLEKAALPQRVRAQELGIAEWRRLAEVVEGDAAPPPDQA